MITAGIVPSHIVGLVVGAVVGAVGADVGANVGARVGTEVVGDEVGTEVVGDEVGAAVGAVGADVGADVGALVAPAALIALSTSASKSHMLLATYEVPNASSELARGWIKNDSAISPALDSQQIQKSHE